MSEEITRRTVLATGAGSLAAATSPALATAAPPTFDPARVVADLERLDDYGAQLDAMKALSAALRARFGMVLVADHVVEQAAALLAEHRDPSSFLRRHGSLDCASAWTEIDLREALTGTEIRPRVLRDGGEFDVGAVAL